MVILITQSTKVYKKLGYPIFKPKSIENSLNIEISENRFSEADRWFEEVLERNL